MIIEALEQEGYGPSSATADEVIRHLWGRGEGLKGELSTARQTLKKVVGGDRFNAIQVQ